MQHTRLFLTALLLSYTLGVALSPHARAGEQPLWSKQARSEILSLTFSNDGQYIAAREYDLGLVLYRASNGDSLGIITGGFGNAFFLPGNEFLLEATPTGIAKYRVGTWEFVGMFEQDAHNISSAAFSPDGRYAAATYTTEDFKSGGIRIWDIASGKILRSKALFSNQDLNGISFDKIAFSCDNSRLILRYIKSFNAAPTEEIAYITAFDAQTFDSLQSYGSFAPPYNSADFKFSNTCSMMVFHHIDKRLDAFDYPSMKKRFNVSTLNINAIAFTKNDKTMLAGWSGILSVNTQTGQSHKYTDDASTIGVLSLSPDEKYIIGSVSEYLLFYRYNSSTSIIDNGTPDVLYPNPATNQVSLPLDGMQQWDISLHSIEGVLLRTLSSKDYTGDGQSVVLNLQDMTPGAYILHLRSAAFTKSYKLIIN